MFSQLASRHRLPIVFVNQVGGNDELIFDGGSFVADSAGAIHGALPLFDSAFGIVEIPAPDAGLPHDGVPDAPAGPDSDAEESGVPTADTPAAPTTDEAMRAIRGHAPGDPHLPPEDPPS